MDYFFMTNFADIFQNVHLFVKQYIDCQKQSVEGALKVLTKSLKTIFDEDHFILNLLYQILIKNGNKTRNISYVIYILNDL